MVAYLVALDRRQKDFLVIENENCTAAYEARIKIKKSKTPNEELVRDLDSISSHNWVNCLSVTHITASSNLFKPN